jgi:hypothetical protein
VHQGVEPRSKYGADQDQDFAAFVPPKSVGQAFHPQLEDAARVLLAKMPKEHSQNGMFCKSAINIDTESNEVRREARQSQKTPEGGLHYERAL